MDTNTRIVWPYWNSFLRKWGQNLLAQFLLFHPTKCCNTLFLTLLYPPPYPITFYWDHSLGNIVLTVPILSVQPVYWVLLPIICKLLVHTALMERCLSPTFLWHHVWWEVISHLPCCQHLMSMLELQSEFFLLSYTVPVWWGSFPGKPAKLLHYLLSDSPSLGFCDSSLAVTTVVHYDCCRLCSAVFSPYLLACLTYIHLLPSVAVHKVSGPEFSRGVCCS